MAMPPQLAGSTSELESDDASNSEDKNKETEEQTEKIGFECEFIEKPPSVLQSECPICLLILREPYQVTCCGKSFCQICIEKIKSEDKPCPTCNGEKVEDFPNKGLQQPFKICCTHQKEGCEWTGELGKLDNHLNLDPQPDKLLEGCAFTKIKCQYSFAGCDVQLLSKDMQSHVQKSSERHFSLLEAKYDTVYTELNTLKANVQKKFPTPPISFTMTKYKYHSAEKAAWYSPSFYTSYRGYKMCLRVDASLLKPLSIQLCMMRGEFDENLYFNHCYELEVGVEVLNQASWQANKLANIFCNYNDKYDCVARVMNQSRSDKSFGTSESKCLIQPSVMFTFIKNDSVEFRIVYARPTKKGE